MLSRELEQERRNVAQQLEKVSQGVRVLIPILNSYLGTLILFRAGHGPRSRSNLNFARRKKMLYNMYDYKLLNIFTCSANMVQKQQVLARWEGKKLIVVFVYWRYSQDKLEYFFIWILRSQLEN